MANNIRDGIVIMIPNQWHFHTVITFKGILLDNYSIATLNVILCYITSKIIVLWFHKIFLLLMLLHNITIFVTRLREPTIRVHLTRRHSTTILICVRNITIIQFIS